MEISQYNWFFFKEYGMVCANNEQLGEYLKCLHELSIYQKKGVIRKVLASPLSLIFWYTKSCNEVC